MIVAIDPGIKGAAAALDGKRGFIDIEDLRTIPSGRRREIDGPRLYNWLGQVQPKRIILENVHSMPQQGIASTFRFGVAFGMIKSICQMWADNRIELVEPAVWKGYFQLGSSKEAARQMALHLFPEEAGRLSRKKDHNRAEAMLIAWWAARPPVGRNW